MKWKIIYHVSVDDDLKSIGPSAAKRIIKTIDKKLTTDPEKYGTQLSNNLKNFRKLQTAFTSHMRSVRELPVH